MHETSHKLTQTNQNSIASLFKPRQKSLDVSEDVIGNSVMDNLMSASSSFSQELGICFT
jgi:hypothetical protein